MAYGISSIILPPAQERSVGPLLREGETSIAETVEVALDVVDQRGIPTALLPHGRLDPLEGPRGATPPLGVREVRGEGRFLRRPHALALYLPAHEQLNHATRYPLPSGLPHLQARLAQVRSPLPHLVAREGHQVEGLGEAIGGLGRVVLYRA